MALEGLAARQPLGRIADVGTGTGILALASLRLGARAAVGVDLDPEALATARIHARLNGESLSLLQGDAEAPLRPAVFDGLVANIAAGPLAERAEGLEALVRPTGFLLLAGLLAEEADAVSARYRRSADRGRLREGEWACVVLERLE
jgi:ribosomal protein L11 methyltransferase